MKKKKIVISECLECPYLELVNALNFEYYCDVEQTEKEGLFTVIASEDTVKIQDFCPLKDEVE